MHPFRHCPAILCHLASFATQAAALAMLVGSVHAADLVPFPVNWKVTAPSPVDLSGLLDAPAGHAGFVTAKDGHFVKPDGSRLRFWGINATGAGALPTNANADLLASGLARRGINCVRLHLLDTPNNGLFPKNTGDTLSLDPARLDRLDYFVAALKRRGIYVNLNLNVLRNYLPGDGVRDAKYIGTAKRITYFDARLLELQRDSASDAAESGDDLTLAFAYFTGSGEEGVRLCSLEGDTTFVPRHGGRPIFTPPAWVGQNRTRDPSIILHEGVFHLAWTSGGRIFGYSRSTDLLHWSGTRQVTPFPEEQPDRPDHVRAPEWQWDPVRKEFLLIFSATSPIPTGQPPRTPPTWDSRLYATTTRDGLTFTPARLFFDPGYAVSDGSLCRDEAGGGWVMIWKDNRRLSPPKVSDNLYAVAITGTGLDQPRFGGTWGPIAGPGSACFASKTMPYAEGASLIRFRDRWWLFWDEYHGAHLQLATSTDLRTWRHETTAVLPAMARHGTAFLVPRRVLAALDAAP